jgi:hypothetical protein
MIRVFAVLCFFVISTFAMSQDKTQTEEQKKRIEELKKKIDEKKKELVQLENELRTLEGTTTKKVDALNLDTMQIGVEGKLKQGQLSGTIVVRQVIDDNNFLAGIIFTRDYDLTVIIKMPTKGFADKQVKDDLFGKTWRVIDTRKMTGSTYFVLELAPDQK